METILDGVLNQTLDATTHFCIRLYRAKNFFKAVWKLHLFFATTVPIETILGSVTMDTCQIEAC